MLLLFHYIIIPILAFALGYWVASHPTDARNIWQRVRDAVGRLVNKAKGEP